MLHLSKLSHNNEILILTQFLPEASFGLQVLSLTAPVCLCVRVFVCPCVCQSRACPHDNSPLVQARITKFWTKVQKTLVEMPIILGDDRPWPSRSNLTWKSNFTSFWACPLHNSSAVPARITKFGPKMHLSTVKMPINFGLDWFWSSHSFSILKPIFYQIYLRSFCIILRETCHLIILVRPSLATDRISLGFWLNISFVVNYRGAFRSIVAIAIDLLTSEDWYFLWITAVPLPRRCLQSRQHSVSRMRRVTLALSGPPNLWSESDHRYLILLLFRQPITSPNYIYLQSDLSCLYKLNCNIFNHHERLFFSASARTTNPPFLLVGCDSWGLFHWRFVSSPKYSLEICVLQKSHFLWAFQAETLFVCPKPLVKQPPGWWRQAAEPASWLCNDFSIPHAPENRSHKNIITIYFHIWT